MAKRKVEKPLQAPGPTMEEIERTLLASLQIYGRIGSNREERVIGRHTLVHMRLGPGYLDCDSSLLIEAWEQIKRTVVLLQAGIEDPKDHRAEALLLMILQQAYYHGYSPRGKY